MPYQTDGRADMDSQQWEAISRVFHKALELNVAERPAFVAMELIGQEDIQTEVKRLLRAHEDAGSWLSGPAFPDLGTGPTPRPNGLTEGDLLCERFLVKREIAVGGMGTVYEVFDQELHSTVALKVVRPEIARDPEALRRFRREVVLARRVTHPNICRTFDLGHTQHAGVEIVFLTMEFLSGRTLAERLRVDGPLKPSHTLHIVREVAEALAVAHSLGIVHRDIKPGNIMLLENPSQPVECRVVVTDFGLAGFASAPGFQNRVFSDLGDEDPLTRSGLPIGTLSYMAPEQLDGRPPTAATDLYALSLVMIEMLTGTRVFAVDRLLGNLQSRPVTIPLSVCLPPDVPSAWASILERCQSHDPQHRYPDVREFVADLESAASAVQQPDGETPSNPQNEGRARPKFAKLRTLLPKTAKASILSVGAIVSAAALFFGILRLLEQKANSAVPAGATVYLAPLTNRTEDHEFNGAVQLLASQLEQSTQVNVLEAGRVDDILREMKRSADAAVDFNVAREIALRAGAVRVIFPSIERDGGTYSLRITIDQPDHDPSRFRSRWMREFRWQSGPGQAHLGPAALASIREAGDWIRQKVGESASDIARLNVPPEDATTASWEALDEYSHAETLLLNGKTQDGITALERATKLDREFSLAYARLGDVLFSVDRWNDGLAAYRQAMSTTTKQRLSRRELDRVRGIYASDTRDYSTAESEFRDLSAYYPEDWRAWFYRALPLLRLDRLQEGIECLKRAHALAPDRMSPIATLAQFNLLAGDPHAVTEWVGALRKQGYRSEAAWIDGEAALLRGDLETAKAQFVNVQASTSPVRSIEGDQLLERLSAEQGHFEQALEPLNNGLRAAEAQGDLGEEAVMLMDRAWLHCRKGEIEDCVQDAERSLAMDRSPHRLRAASLLVLTYAESTQGAQKALLIGLLEHNPILKTGEIGPLFDMAQLEREGALHLAHHHCSAALKAFRAESTIDAPLESREYLASGLEQCARWETSPVRARALRHEAADSYVVAAFRPALVWNMVQFHPPGVYADQLAGWLRTTEDRSERYSEARTVLARLRQPQVSAVF